MTRMSAKDNSYYHQRDTGNDSCEATHILKKTLNFGVTETA